jgi:RNA polymerase sigma factor (TIGR02999 family)
MGSRDITQLLTAWGEGDRAALDELVPLVQHELHRRATQCMAGERPDHILRATALVNEAYVRLVDLNRMPWQNRAQFFAIAAEIMRRVLVDMARARDRAKRGGGRFAVSLTDAGDIHLTRSADLVAVDDALRDLARFDQRKSRVVEMRFFGGLTLDEIAGVLGVSVGTVRRDWTLARAWLHRALSR